MADKWYSEQIGPLPLGVWLLAGAGGLTLAYFQNRKSKAASADATAQDSSGFLSTATGSGAVALPGGSINTGLPSSSTTQPTTYLDNIAWQRGAITEMIARGYDSTLVVQALSDYLNGVALSSSEQAVVSTALKVVGPPPYPPTLVPAPTPAPVTTPQTPPIYPTFYPNPNGPGTYGQCPSGRVPVAGSTGWTCATLQEYNDIAAYVGHNNG